MIACIKERLVKGMEGSGMLGLPEEERDYPEKCVLIKLTLCKC